MTPAPVIGRYRVLEEFRGLFDGKQYNHRISTHGDRVAAFLYEDLLALGASDKFAARVRNRSHVLNKKNRAIGKPSRRGDGTFGERVPASEPTAQAELAVAVAEVATIEIGVEVKILAKAMIKQIDRVCNDLDKQVTQFRTHNKHCICIAMVGVNYAPQYTSYEADRAYPTDGKKYSHPIQEAEAAEKHIVRRVVPKFDEVMLLRFRASNVAPYPFEWVNYDATVIDYSAQLLRVSRVYDERF